MLRITDEFSFVYEGPNLKFEFSVVDRKETRSLTIRGRLTERKMSVASVIVEPSLERGLANATHGHPPRQDAYDMMKSDILAGLFALLTWGGRLLSFVPDYQIEFAQ